MKIFVLLILLLSSCAQHKTEKNKVTELKININQPSWINEPQKGCPQGYLCFSKEGSDCNASDAETKKEAVGFFKTQVTGKTQYNLDSHNNLNYSEIIEEANLAVELKVDEELSGFEILNRLSSENACFSHGGFDKQKMSENFLENIKQLDLELQNLYKTKLRSAVPKLFLLYEKRQLLAKYNDLIDGAKYPETITWNMIFALKENKRLNNNVFLSIVGEIPEPLKKFFDTELSNSGFVTTNAANFSYRIEVTFKAVEEYLNIEGFKKYNFIFEAESFDNFKNKLGKMVIQKIASGRNQQDAYFKIKPEMELEIKKQLISLKMK
jgi:hypothetical protein